MTARIREFLKNRHEDGPCLVLDLDVVRDNYASFSRALPDTRVFYAVKANPAPEILKVLADLGSSFDVASVSETCAGISAMPCRRPSSSRAAAWSAMPALSRRKWC